MLQIHGAKYTIGSNGELAPDHYAWIIQRMR
jgi:hypothetical protein